MTSISDKVYGNDVGLTFEYTSVGMKEGFMHSTVRVLEVELREEDNGASK